MALFNILDLTHWSEWGDLLFIWKHKYSLPTGGGLVLACKRTGVICTVVFNSFKQGGIDVAWTLWFCFRGVTHEWMSYVFEVSFLFWIAALSLLSRLDEMEICVELLADDVWAVEEDKTDFLSVGVDIFDRLYLREWPISFPMVTMSTKKRIYNKWDYVKKSTKSKYVKFLMNDQNIMFGLSPPLWKNSKNRKMSNN